MTDITRRDFVKTAGSAVASTSLLGVTPAFAQPAARRRYAIVGTGDRASGMWGRSIAQRYSDVVEFVGLCDINPKRVEVAKELIGVSCPTFTSFDEMCDKAKPDLLMVTTVDAFHSEYIVKALDRGMDVMTEKPMVIDERQCQAVLDAEARNNRKIVVTFNYRYAPKHRTIKEILMSGEIGKVLSVDFSWYLDVYHGADYFRRWHRLRKGGGTLWVHKATHHFDLINWWLGADPVEVVAEGKLRVYGKNNPFRFSNCRPCPYKQECRFYYDMTKNETRMKLYAACEAVDHYHRDGCVWREDIDIFDTMNAVIEYSNGVVMSYSLNAHMPFEGYRLAFNGEIGWERSASSLDLHSTGSKTFQEGKAKRWPGKDVHENQNSSRGGSPSSGRRTLPRGHRCKRDDMKFAQRLLYMPIALVVFFKSGLYTVYRWTGSGYP